MLGGEETREEEGGGEGELASPRKMTEGRAGLSGDAGLVQARAPVCFVEEGSRLRKVWSGASLRPVLKRADVRFPASRELQPARNAHDVP